VLPDPAERGAYIRTPRCECAAEASLGRISKLRDRIARISRELEVPDLLVAAEEIESACPLLDQLDISLACVVGRAQEMPLKPTQRDSYPALLAGKKTELWYILKVLYC
jgi:hypothetical protein